MKAVIRSIVQETDLVRRVELEVPELKDFVFKPGQFVVITLPELPEGANERSYSISSHPAENNRFELCIVINPNGAATPLLWKLQVGDTLEVSEAKGNFVLAEPIETDTAFICTGTGVAPFRSMIYDMLERNKTNKNIYLIFGNRFEKDILYRKEFEELAKKYPHFHFIPVLSREENWNGEKGYVHPIYERIFSDHRDARFYVCGWDAMCTEARHRLKAMGYNRRQYFFELYD